MHRKEGEELVSCKCFTYKTPNLLIYFVDVNTPSLIPDFNRPFVFFRKPGTVRIQYWYSTSPAVLTDSPQTLLGTKHGWITAPFHFYEDPRLWVFPADGEQSFTPEAWSQVSIPAQSDGLPPALELADTPRTDFGQWVGEAAAQIRSGIFRKTALSKVRNRSLAAEFDWATWFGAACERFPNALVFFVHLPGIYTWAGATPELLLSADGKEVHSVSLAGTLHPDSVGTWTGKEAEEQALVTGYIREVFQRAGFADVAVSEPEILSIGRLQHLKTSFSAPYAASETHRLLELVRYLHPTPAVGGLPKKEGVAFLLQHETHPRHLYSGFLGSILHSGEMDLFVNLRSMAVGKGKAILYAGAGITGQSDPEAEWLETENKLQMNLDLLK